ncbi:MAG: hypothetical protein JXX14_18045 [Deltaproteobacteria bacterium]|nr:hypothetical protein [Deltaproteobacteria bacterium]
MKKRNLSVNFALVFFGILMGCSDGGGAAAVGDTGGDTADTSSADTVSQNDYDTVDTGVETDLSGLTGCGTLFGIPAEQTGLGATQCRPVCDCGGETFAPTTLSDAALNRLTTMTLLNPPALQNENPYGSAVPSASPDDAQVCGVTIGETAPDTYRLDTFPSADAAIAAGAVVTHFGACGQCSSLADLAVYMRTTDLTGPVRQCGIQGMTGGEATNIACLKALGFTDTCAQIWYYNTVNTRTVCLETCAVMLGDNYHLPTGEINACLQCDEDNSGPIFKAVAGRTRRNSGLPSGICRPCETVRHVTHAY